MRWSRLAEIASEADTAEWKTKLSCSADGAMQHPGRSRLLPPTPPADHCLSEWHCIAGTANGDGWQRPISYGPFQPSRWASILRCLSMHQVSRLSMGNHGQVAARRHSVVHRIGCI